MPLKNKNKRRISPKRYSPQNKSLLSIVHKKSALATLCYQCKEPIKVGELALTIEVGTDRMFRQCCCCEMLALGKSLNKNVKENLFSMGRFNKANNLLIADSKEISGDLFNVPLLMFIKLIKDCK